MSLTILAACHASTRFPDANIHVINSRQLSTSIGIMAIKAAEMAKNNESANAIAIRLERTLGKFRQFGLADSVDFFAVFRALSQICSCWQQFFKCKI